MTYPNRPFSVLHESVSIGIAAAMEISKMLRHVEMGPNGNRCWEWTACKKKDGYAKMKWRGRSVLVHRFLYEVFREPIADGMCLHHLCRNRCCVNPWHTELVEPEDHALESNKVRWGHTAKSLTPPDDSIPI
jgi:hypothetical protein